MTNELRVHKLSTLCALLCAACGGHSTGRARDAGTSGGDDAALDAEILACTPSGAFASERVPGPDPHTWYDGSVLHVAAGVPQVLISERSESVSFTAGILDW